MSDYSSLKATINANIKANNNHEITGAITNSVLNAMVDSLGAGYQFMGVATPTNPGSAQTPDYKCFYLATTPGTYTYLGGLVVADGEVALLKYDSSWTKEVTGIASADKLNQLGQEVREIAGNPILLTINKHIDTSSANVGNTFTAYSSDLSNCACAEIEVNNGDNILIIGKASTPYVGGYVIVDSNNVVTRISDYQDRTETLLTIASNEKKIYVNLYPYDSDTDGIWNYTYENLTKATKELQELEYLKIFEVEKNILQGDVPTLMGVDLSLYPTESSWNANGEIVSTSYYRAISQPIPVIGGESYEIKNMQGDAYTSGILNFYGADDLLISQEYFGADDSDKTVIAPDNATWIGLTMNKYVAESQISGVKVIGKYDTGKVVSDNLQITNDNLPDSVDILQDTEPFYDNNEDVLPDILDGVTLVSASNGTYYNGNGEVVTNPYDSYTNAITPLIDVSAGQTYKIKKFYGSLMFLDSSGHNGEQITCITGDLFQLDDYTFTVPAGKTKVGITYNRTVVKDIKEIKILKQTLNNIELHQQPISFENAKLYTENLSPSLDKMLLHFYGKNIVFMGHSLVGNANPPYDIPSIINALLGTNAKNCAFGGSTVSEHEDSNYDKFALYNLVDAIIEQDFSAQEAVLNNVPAMYADHLDVLESIDFSKVDILVFCSVENDIRNAKAISNPNDSEDTNTVIGAYNYIFRKMMTAFPNLSIFLCSPHYEYYTDLSQDSDTYVNSLGLKASDYMEAMGTMAHKTEIPFINIYDIGVNKYNWNTYLDDGYHFTDKGKMLFSRIMVKSLF